MSDLSNNIAILSYLKDKVHKWKNISITLIIVILLLVFKMILPSSIDRIETGSYIAQINIKDTIFEDEFRSKVLKKIKEDSSIKALIFNINSPGGSMVGSEILYNELQAIKANKPIVAVMSSVAASGGYMISLASDYIIAHNGTLTGSIGVMMQSPELGGLARKIGFDLKTYKSAPLKAVPNPFERPSAYANKVIQSSIDDSASFFFDLVKKNRGKRLAKSKYNIAFDGRVFTGRQAIKIGLIDEIGNFDSALSYLKNVKKINIDKFEVKEIKLEDPKEVFLKKLSGFLPISVKSNSKIMAVLPF